MRREVDSVPCLTCLCDLGSQVTTYKGGWHVWNVLVRSSLQRVDWQSRSNDGYRVKLADFTCEILVKTFIITETCAEGHFAFWPK